MSKSSTLIFTATYNEVDNISQLLDRIAGLQLDADVLVIDDNSPDGTAEVVKRKAESLPRITLMERSGKLGIGSAHLQGLRYGIEHGYRTLVSLDADFSHSPEDIPRFLDQKERYDVVLGTRFLSRASLEEWSFFRRCLTHTGHFLTRVLLRLPYDASGALRLYRLDRIPPYVWQHITSRDYEFFFESLTVLHAARVSIGEIPINLPARATGHSKMRPSHMVRGLRRLFSMAAQLATVRKRLASAVGGTSAYDAARVSAEWNTYWERKGDTAHRLYDFAARLYRDHLIKPSLSRAIRATFQPGMRLLHAGCGGGEVDFDVVEYADVTALDISPKAIERYSRLHGTRCKCVVGDIFNLSQTEGKYDGIYNLGVMEHFEEDQINRVLREFNKVLADGGHIVLFWPPAYGLSVIALHGIHFVLNKILRKNIRLHPDEPTKVGRRSRVRMWLEQAGFELEQFSFGIRDAFTYVVIVARKARAVS